MIENPVKKHLRVKEGPILGSQFQRDRAIIAGKAWQQEPEAGLQA